MNQPLVNKISVKHIADKMRRQDLSDEEINWLFKGLEDHLKELIKNKLAFLPPNFHS